MSSQIPDVPAPFSPLVKLNLPSPEEYRKRKVALVSGKGLDISPIRSIMMMGDWMQVLLVKTARICKFCLYPMKEEQYKRPQLPARLMFQ